MSEDTSVGRGYDITARLLNATHSHTKMLSLNDYRDALWLKHLDYSIGDLAGETLLELRTFGNNIDKSCHFTGTDNPAIRYIAYMR